MEKILNIEIFDMFPYEHGFIFSKKIRTDEGRVKISYNTFLTELGESHSISRGAYLFNKFGETYKNIANQLGDYVTCDSTLLPDGRRMVVFPSGEYGIFTANGMVQSTGDLKYKEDRAHGICMDGENFWSVVPNSNCVLRYNVKSLGINMRIGGGRASAFERPEDIVMYDGKLYVCCAESCCVKSIDLKDYSIRTYIVFDEPIWKYLRVNGKEFVLLNSGIYKL
ncbi:MAG: hypothetical protein IKU25_08770 [Clostridia bacterium]|nr:hypothetical protein [Clostridia bacterium]